MFTRFLGASILALADAPSQVKRAKGKQRIGLAVIAFPCLRYATIVFTALRGVRRSGTLSP